MAQHVKIHIVLTEDQVPFPEPTKCLKTTCNFSSGDPVPLLISSVISGTHDTHTCIQAKLHMHNINKNLNKDLIMLITEGNNLRSGNGL